ncbi:hypothetical protein Z043_125717, partial [Scleropages formosus]
MPGCRTGTGRRCASSSASPSPASAAAVKRDGRAGPSSPPPAGHPENGDAPRGRAAAESRLDVSELPSAGGFGRFQKELLVLTWVPALLVGFSQFSDYFLLAQPTNTCVWWGNVTLPDGTAAGIINGTAIDGSATDGRTAGGARDNGSARCVCAGGPYELEQGLAQNVVTT